MGFASANGVSKLGLCTLQVSHVPPDLAKTLPGQDTGQGAQGGQVLVGIEALVLQVARLFPLSEAISSDKNFTGGPTIETCTCMALPASGHFPFTVLHF